MSSVSLGSFMLFFVLVALATFVGTRLVLMVSWTGRAQAAGLPFAVGMASGPFLVGLLSVFALTAMPGSSRLAHLTAIGGGLVVASGALWAVTRQGRQPGRIPATRPWSALESWLAGLLLLWCFALLFNATALPLTQNDSLEYALVGRALLEHPGIDTYPLLDTQKSTSGFFGPWTHPPLYVALIYLTNLVQGHAQTPGLMRLIAPWFALAGTAVVFALGQLHSRLLGLLASIFFISTPLFFLGADSSLIDSLPVAGMTLILATILGLEKPLGRAGVAQGAALGLSLWTHSQAVLFVPLTAVALLFRDGVNWPRPFTNRIGQFVAVFVTAALIAGWPYWRNMLIFGSPISDNPLVFAIPGLAWEDYFALARGISTWPEKIQYGLLKGWFAPEAYGPVFWLALLGGVLHLRQSRLLQPLPPESRVLHLAGALVLCYLAGVVVSLLLGIDLMIRNERYWLVILPMVALFAGRSLTPVLADRSPRRIAALAGLTLICLAQVTVLSGYRLHSNGFFGAGTGNWGDALLRHRPNLDTIRHLDAQSPRQGLVLAMKPADMFYSSFRMVSYLDPRLEPFYAEKGPERAAALLRDLGVEYIQATDYGLPPLYNSALQDILADPALTRLLHSSDGNQIYQMRSPETARIASDAAIVNITPGLIGWTERRQLLIGGRKALGRLTGNTSAYVVKETAGESAAWPVFQRDWSTILTVGESDVITVDSSREYRVEIAFKGMAFVQIWLQQLDALGHPVKGNLARSATNVLIGEMAVRSGEEPVRYVRRLRFHPETRRIRLGIEYRGSARLTPTEVLLQPLPTPIE